MINIFGRFVVFPNQKIVRDDTMTAAKKPAAKKAAAKKPAAKKAAPKKSASWGTSDSKLRGKHPSRTK